MKIEPRNVDSVLILDVAGDVTMRNCQQLRDRVTEATQQGQRKLALNFASVDSMDSAGLAALIEIVQLVKQKDADVRFFSITRRVRAVMEITHLDQFLPLSWDEASALAELE